VPLFRLKGQPRRRPLDERRKLAHSELCDSKRFGRRQREPTD
jgi:hypothetical protein